jgi:hypothetical protein
MATIEKVKMPSTATLGDTVQEHVSRRLAELFPDMVSIPRPDRDERQQRIVQRATENQQYYLEKAVTSGKPWLHCWKQDLSYNEEVLITPQMAAELMKFNKENRQISPSQVDSFSRDVVNGRWMQSGECLKIDYYGNFFDGQHRALGIIKANKPCIIAVYWNLPPEGRFVVDSGRKRNVNEKINMIVGDSCGLGNKISSVCKSMMMGVAYRGSRYTESEVAAFIEIHKDTLCWLAKSIPGLRSDAYAVVGKALLWYGEKKITPFCEKYRKMVFPISGDPVCALYRFLHKKGQSNHVIPGFTVYKKALAAIEHFLNGKLIDRLHDRTEDIFEWESGWRVPSNAPANL